MFADLRGEDYVESLRAYALIATLNNTFLSCCTCRAKAEFVGMQQCGAPGGPRCGKCVQEHREYVDAITTIAGLGDPYCRHCGKGVDRSHCYTVDLWDGTKRSI
jgi:hypothetical protein